MSQDSPHYFTTPQPGPAPRRELRLTLAGQALTLSTAAGVFSGDRLDLGTRVLLREVPEPPSRPGADLLDLGCGWGPLAITAALLAPDATVWAVDVNERALELTAENARTAGCSNVRAVLPQDVPADVRFATIWSNPPIRIGKQPLHDLLLRWLPRLEPGTDAHLVVQKHLGSDSLQTWLADALPATGTPGWRVGRLGSAKGYRVLTVTAPN